MAETNRSTDPLRERHRQLVARVEELRIAAAGAADADRAAVRDRVARAITLLDEGLVPHARVEEATLYPTVEAVMGSPGATAGMRRDHVEIARMTDALRFLQARLEHNPTRETIEALRRLLYGLYAVLMLHFAKEEELYLPLLDRELAGDAAETLVRGMDERALQAL
ncbi:MAG TPA: hemerythrin domain-containing protein [Candidatus Limnocylindrales bacterium]|nr:hemerythrin domain-containing protein [Candidatus Limnocylindrales bacterium]